MRYREIGGRGEGSIASCEVYTGNQHVAIMERQLSCNFEKLSTLELTTKCDWGTNGRNEKQLPVTLSIEGGCRKQ